MSTTLTSIHGRRAGLTNGGALRAAGLTGMPESVVNVTAATLTVVPNTHAGRIITINAAAGCVCSLPAATGSGDVYTFLVGTTITSNAAIVKVANATDTMVGYAILAQDSADTMVEFDAVAGTSDTVSLNGSTTGGIKGASIVVRDIKLDGTNAIWLTEVFSTATGTEATVFSATVS